MSHVIGIDTSTTATKALVIDAHGEVLGQDSASYDYDIPKPTWAEQDPRLWWDATISSIRRAVERSGLSAGQIDAIGLTGQMHGSVLLDEDGAVVRPALLWNDQRTSAECDEIRSRVGRDELIATTGNDAITGFTAPKLLWVRNNEPDSWSRVRTVLLPKDYVRWRLSGALAVDVAGGSGTGLFDLAGRTWSPTVLDSLDLDRSLFPKAFEGPEVTGRLTPEAAAATIGVPSRSPVAAAASGALAVDVAGGSGTGLFDLSGRTWSPTVLDSLDLDRSLFPEAFEGPEVTGRLTPEAAAATGLLEGTPIVAGGGDQSANAVGVGAIRSGVVALSLGTSGVVFATTDGPTIEGEARVQAFCHAVPDRWHMMGVMLSAAGSLRWFRDTLARDLDFDEIDELADEIPAGAEGLLFLPYLSGERTPYADPLARGAFVGLTTSHDLRHMARAVLEGVAFGLKDILDSMVDAGVPRPDAIHASGGGLKSVLWRQILADVLEARIETPVTEEGAAYGAGLLASVGAGHFDSVDSAVSELIEVRPAAEPGGAAQAYTEAHARYQGLYPALRPTFHAVD